MMIFKKVSTLAVRHICNPEPMGVIAESLAKKGIAVATAAAEGALKVAGSVAEEAGAKLLGDWAKQGAKAVRAHFTDHSETLIAALDEASERAWKSIEVALGGDRWCASLSTSKTDKDLRTRMRVFVESAALPTGNPEFLDDCLTELRMARKKGHLERDVSWRRPDLEDELEPFARYDDPDAILKAECTAVADVGQELMCLGYPNLGQLLQAAPTRGQPLLAMAAQFYFRRKIVEDDKLRNEMTWVKLVAIEKTLSDGFEFVVLLVGQYGEQLLAGQVEMSRKLDLVHDQIGLIQRKIEQLERVDPLPRRDLSLSHTNSCKEGWAHRLVTELLTLVNELPEDQRRLNPSLLLQASRRAATIGNSDAAESFAQLAVEYLNEPTEKALGEHNRYLVALTQGKHKWPEALETLKRAVALDPSLAPWPPGEYEVEAVLGAGGSAVAFRAKHWRLEDQVVFKTLREEELESDLDKVFQEADVLKSLHGTPGIIGVRGCGFANHARKKRPYLTLDYFAGSQSLEDRVRPGPDVLRPLSPEELWTIADQTARALLAAHLAGILHRDVKPANLLIVKNKKGGWDVKVIDFGIASRRLRDEEREATRKGTATRGWGVDPSDSRYTFGFAAPEQLEPKRAKEIGPHTDVYGFGMTFLFAAFGTTQPDHRMMRELTDDWLDLLFDCCQAEIAMRPKDFAVVLERLAAIGGPPPPPPTPPPPPPPTRFTNSLGMPLVRIEPGSYLRGSTKEQIDTLMSRFPNLDRKWLEAEQPQKRIEISRPFYLGVHQVTVGQFREFVDRSEYQTEAERNNAGSHVWDGKGWKLDPKKNWRDPGFTPKQGEDHPVTCVSHNDALAFIKWLNQQEKEAGWTYRLPTEAEWEYACRAGTGGLWGASDDPTGLKGYANIADQSLLRRFPNTSVVDWDDGYVYTSPVGKFTANAWGLCDMIGNVWEWCDDFYDPEFYKRPETKDPPNTKEAPNRVNRGGSWNLTPGYCRSADRSWNTPDFRDDDLGFRLAAGRFEP